MRPALAAIVIISPPLGLDRADTRRLSTACSKMARSLLGYMTTTWAHDTIEQNSGVGEIS